MSIARDEVQMTTDWQCSQCGRQIVIPLKRDWNSPLYVMHMEQEHKVLRDQLIQMQRDLIELAQECVNAGVRPEILKRADATRKLFEELKERLGINGEGE